MMNRLYAPPIIDTIRKVLDLVDPRLIDHGVHVANLVHSVLTYQGKYTRQQIDDLCILALIHDIGAYKTEEIDKMMSFETLNVWDHSLYGYLYAKYFSPLDRLAPALFFHHADNADFGRLGGEAFEIGQIINIADRIDIIGGVSKELHEDLIVRYFRKNKGVKYRADLLELFDNRSMYQDLRRDSTRVWFATDRYFTKEEADRYLEMIVLTIDFRSPQTVTHTVSTTAVSRKLAKMAGLSEAEVEAVRVGAMLHDIGKQGIPGEILEAPGKLSAKAMDIMRTHVQITDRVIRGNIDERIRRIAVRHHEKLDGSGYPEGLTARNLSMGERVLAVSDIFSALTGVRSYKGSFSREKTLKILVGMVSDNQLDRDLVGVIVDNYDGFIDAIEEEALPVVRGYVTINKEFSQLKNDVGAYLANPAEIPESIAQLGGRWRMYNVA